MSAKQTAFNHITKIELSEVYYATCSPLQTAAYFGCSKAVLKRLLRERDIEPFPSPQRYSQAKLIALCILVHNGRYSYEHVIHPNDNSLIKITCHTHGIFEMMPSDHLRGRGCKQCYLDGVYYSQDEIIAKMLLKHSGKYCYDLVVFINTYTPIKIICHTHGVFEQRPKDHLRGQGCLKCFCDDLRKSNDEFKLEATIIHNGFYSYDKVEYENANKKVIIICPIHGDFKCTPHNHLNGTGCLKCTHHSISKPEVAWLDFLSIPDELRHRNIKVNGKRYNLDAFDPSTNTVYEFYGDYWHGNPKIFAPEKEHPSIKVSYGTLYKNTINRENALKLLGYKIISIWEHDWNLLKEGIKNVKTR